MNGLDLETFLILLRADLVAWAMIGVAGIGLAMLAWSSWRSRRVLRSCLLLALAAHLGLVIYGSTVPAVRKAIRGWTPDPADREHIRRIRVTPIGESDQAPPRPGRPGGTTVPSAGTSLALSATTPSLADPLLRLDRSPVVDLAPKKADAPAPPIAMGAATPRPARPGPAISPPGPRADAVPATGSVPPVPSAPSPTDTAELDRMTTVVVPPTDRPNKPEVAIVIEGAVGKPGRALRNDVRLRPGRSRPGDRPAIVGSSPRAGASARPGPTPTGPIAMEHVTPPSRTSPAVGSELAALGERPAVRTPAEVPRVYRSRVEPDRPTRARLAGASVASELAVERALDWLARHQDDDGRWNAAVARYDDGRPVPGDRDFTAHCPADQICSGPCAYWEADSALTGLALLTYLGAGYTHLQGRYAETVGNGLEYLIRQQKRDGDLRGVSAAVGMYCHAMATLALCEGYALTGDARLREPAERAVGFLVRSRARDRQAWRYQPGEPIGDTSILGWVVMSLKSAHEIGLTIPQESSVRRGVLDWLDRVASGGDRGLACYQPGNAVTPTMTAEAWVCRQFLDVGGPGPASTEAAEFLLRNETDPGPTNEFLLRNETDRGRTNYYYWYYATLALYQHGGEPWSRWNAEIRDRIVKLQRTSGHIAGSWDPDARGYGAKGGRVCGTALAALTLEVYYRYLRLYGEPKIGSDGVGAPELAPPRR